MKLLLCCSKVKPYLYHKEEYCSDTMNRIDLGYEIENYVDSELKKEYEDNCLNGKIVAECDDYEVEEIKYIKERNGCGYQLKNVDNFDFQEMLDKSCLSFENLENYLGNNNGYAIRIKNLRIFDEPRELNKYCKDISKVKNCWSKNKGSCNFGYSIKFPGKWVGCEKGRLSKAPQNMMYVFDGDGKKVLISIHPEVLCKILNGECDIIIKKNILKEMLK